jgi:hypothetical protein
VVPAPPIPRNEVFAGLFLLISSRDRREQHPRGNANQGDGDDL